MAIGSCCDGPHRRSLQPIDGGLYLAQRFAIDFNLLDAEHRLSAGEPGLLSSYPNYDQRDVTVADATVVAAVDRYPDQVPGQTVGVTLENADGNHVVLDLGDRAYAFYAHLAPGSITVHAGDRVTQGQQIGRLGNSGSSNGPHLHFHVMDHPSALVADGLPYVFERFDFTGQIPPSPRRPPTTRRSSLCPSPRPAPARAATSCRWAATSSRSPTPAHDAPRAGTGNRTGPKTRPDALATRVNPPMAWAAPPKREPGSKDSS